jgi:hypothetical protein
MPNRASPPADGIRIANPDAERDAQKEVPQVEVESRENMGSMLDIDLESLDKAFKYRWVHVAPIKVARAKQKGYVFVDADEETIVNLVGDSPDTEGGRIRVGDVVLMKCPRTIHRARRKRVAEKTKIRLRGPKRKFKREASSDQVRRRYGTPVAVITDKEPKGSGE